MALNLDNTPNYVAVSIKGKDGTTTNYKIRELAGDEAERIDAALSKRIKSTIVNGKPVIQSVDLVGNQFDLLTIALVKDDDSKVTKDELQEFKSSILATLYDEAQKLNQLGDYSPKAKKEDKEKNG